MANITVSLPADGDSIVAANYNTPVNTIVNEINGKLDNSNIASGAAVDGAKLADETVTSDKIDWATIDRPKIGVISAATLSSTGNKSITGVGFKPSLVRFTLLPTDGTATTAYVALGSMDSAGTQFYTWIAHSTSSNSRGSGTDAAFGFAATGTTTKTNIFSYVSMDADGFTINVTTASGSFNVGYEAYP